MPPCRRQRRRMPAGPRWHRRCWRGRRPRTALPAAAHARRGTPAPWRFGGSSSSRGWIPKRPPCTANSQCALACHTTARAHALITTVAASGPRQRASPRSGRSAGASSASRGSSRTRLLMLAPARACRTASMGAVTLITEEARPSLSPPQYSHAVGGERSRPLCRDGEVGSACASRP